jgi:hypothetical protein
MRAGRRAAMAGKVLHAVPLGDDIIDIYESLL